MDTHRQRVLRLAYALAPQEQGTSDAWRAFDRGLGFRAYGLGCRGCDFAFRDEKFRA